MEVTKEQVLAIVADYFGTDCPDEVKRDLVPIEDAVRAALTTAQSEAAELRGEVERLKAELSRRDANENRNCINWGPCSRHDKRMNNENFVDRLHAFLSETPYER